MKTLHCLGFAIYTTLEHSTFTFVAVGEHGSERAPAPREEGSKVEGATPGTPEAVAAEAQQEVAGKVARGRKTLERVPLREATANLDAVKTSKGTALAYLAALNRLGNIEDYDYWIDKIGKTRDKAERQGVIDNALDKAINELGSQGILRLPDPVAVADRYKSDSTRRFIERREGKRGPWLVGLRSVLGVDPREVDDTHAVGAVERLQAYINRGLDVRKEPRIPENGILGPKMLAALKRVDPAKYGLLTGEGYQPKSAERVEKTTEAPVPLSNLDPDKLYRLGNEIVYVERIGAAGADWTLRHPNGTRETVAVGDREIRRANPAEQGQFLTDYFRIHANRNPETSVTVVPESGDKKTYSLAQAAEMMKGKTIDPSKVKEYRFLSV